MSDERKNHLAKSTAFGESHDIPDMWAGVMKVLDFLDCPYLERERLRMFKSASELLTERQKVIFDKSFTVSSYRELAAKLDIDTAVAFRAVERISKKITRNREKWATPPPVSPQYVEG